MQPICDVPGYNGWYSNRNPRNEIMLCNGNGVVDVGRDLEIVGNYSKMLYFPFYNLKTKIDYPNYDLDIQWGSGHLLTKNLLNPKDAYEPPVRVATDEELERHRSHFLAMLQRSNCQKVLSSEDYKRYNLNLQRILRTWWKVTRTKLDRIGDLLKSISADSSQSELRSAHYHSMNFVTELMIASDGSMEQCSEWPAKEAFPPLPDAIFSPDANECELKIRSWYIEAKSFSKRISAFLCDQLLPMAYRTTPSLPFSPEVEALIRSGLNDLHQRLSTIKESFYLRDMRQS
jgi:hypothetical protein